MVSSGALEKTRLLLFTVWKPITAAESEQTNCVSFGMEASGVLKL